MAVERAALVIQQVRLDGRRAARRGRMRADVHRRDVPRLIDIDPRRVNALWGNRLAFRPEQIRRREIQLAPELLAALNHAAERIRAAEQPRGLLHFARRNGRAHPCGGNGQAVDLHLVHNVRLKAVFFPEAAHILRLARAHPAKGVIEADDHVLRMQRVHKRLHKRLRRLRGIRPVKRTEHRRIDSELSDRANFFRACLQLRRRLFRRIGRHRMRRKRVDHALEVIQRRQFVGLAHQLRMPFVHAVKHAEGNHRLPAAPLALVCQEYHSFLAPQTMIARPHSRSIASNFRVSPSNRPIPQNCPFRYSRVGCPG